MRSGSRCNLRLNLLQRNNSGRGSMDGTRTLNGVSTGTVIANGRALALPRRIAISSMSMSVTAQYASLVAARKIERDPAQEAVVEKLATLETRLAEHRLARKSSSLGWLFARAPKAEPIKGLYVFGEVGRGKTMLMDLFFEASPVVRKRRVHFHEFMADVHERVFALPAEAQGGRDRRRGPDRGSRPTTIAEETLAALLRRVPRHRHRRRDDPGPAVHAAVRARRGGGGDLERAAGRALQGRAQPRAVPAVHRAHRAAHGRGAARRAHRLPAGEARRRAGLACPGGRARRCGARRRLAAPRRRPAGAPHRPHA